MKVVTGAASCAFIPDQYAQRYQSLDVAAGSILRTLGDFRPLRGGQLTFETVEESAQEEALACIQGTVPVCFPKAGLGKHLVQLTFACGNC